jgi:hypothetical protein
VKELPTVPAHDAAPIDLLPGRRTVLGWVTYGLGALATLVMGLPVLGYFLGVPKKPKDEDLWIPLGPADEKTFPVGQTRLSKPFDNPMRQPWDGEAAKTQVYVRNNGKDEKGNPDFLVLAVNCAHLGCPVQFFQESGLFMCPCHGGVYYGDGKRASGPPPRDLFQCVWKVEKDPKTKADTLLVQAPFYPSLQNPLRPGDKGGE